LPTYVSRSLPMCSSYWHRKRATLPFPATLNDVLLYAMFRSLAHHQEQYEAKGRDPLLRIAMPMDMRSSQEPLSPASNRSSLVFLDRRPSQIANAAELLSWVYRETQHIKRHQLGCVFFDCLAVLKQVPFGLQLAVHDRRRALSAIVSNLGICEFPSMPGTVKHVQFLPPLRPGTAVALGVATCRQELQLTLHYDHRLLTLTAATAMLDRFVDDLLPLLKPMD
jgi:NRPS condensation-like uncharacterized protein